MKISVAGSGYVGLSLSILLAQHNDVTVVDIIDEKVRLINQGISPIKDADIEEYLKNAPLNLTATLDGASAYSNADLIIIATPTIMTANATTLTQGMLKRSSSRS